MSYKTVNGTGTGEIVIFIVTQDNLPISQAQLITPQAPGTYNVEWHLSTEPDPDCEPPLCETWAPGNYTAVTGK